MIPEEKRAAVSRALQEAFGVDGFDDIAPLSGGQSSARVFRIMVRGKPYLLRIVMTPNPMVDPNKELAAMKAAAQAGAAPKVWYASIEDRLLLTDYVQPQPYPDDMATRLAPVLRTVHTLSGFPYPQTGEYFKTIDRFIGQVQEKKIVPESALEEPLRGYSEVTSAYPWGDRDLVACHNDLKPQNMVFDGERVWLVDWEASFLNDRYVDLSVAANFFVFDDAQEAAYLEAYFGEPASNYQRARFFLMRQVVHVFYGIFFLYLLARAGAPVDLAGPAPDSREFHRRLIAGELDTLVPEIQVQYAKLHLDSAAADMRTPRFGQSLAVVKAGWPS